MTVTERLRAMLDERGVEWADEENKIDRVTTWNVNDGHAVFYESKTACPAFLKFIYYDPTPEQAIEATLGRGECEQEEHGWSTEGDHARVWLTCGHDCMVETVADLPNYCPNCGRKVRA